MCAGRQPRRTFQQNSHGLECIHLSRPVGRLCMPRFGRSRNIYSRGRRWQGIPPVWTLLDCRQGHVSPSQLPDILVSNTRYSRIASISCAPFLRILHTLVKDVPCGPDCVRACGGCSRIASISILPRHRSPCRNSKIFPAFGEPISCRAQCLKCMVELLAIAMEGPETLRPDVVNRHLGLDCQMNCSEPQVASP